MSWIEKFGSDKIILGADVKNEKVAVGGWLETTTLDLMPFVTNYMAAGITKVICTDITKDGMLAGPSLDLYRKMLAEQPSMYLIASGGVSSIADIELLIESGVPAVITGKAIYEGKISLPELSRYC